MICARREMGSCWKSKRKRIMRNVIKILVLVALVATVVWSMCGCCSSGSNADKSTGSVSSRVATIDPSWSGRTGI